MKKQKDQVATAKEIRERLGIVDRTMSRWLDAGLPCKRGPGGKNPTMRLWDLLEFIYKRKPDAEASDGGESPALDRYRLAKAEEAERKNAVEMGALVKREEVSLRIRAAYSSVRAQLEAALRSQPELQQAVIDGLEIASKQLDKEFPGDARL